MKNKPTTGQRLASPWRLFKDPLINSCWRLVAECDFEDGQLVTAIHEAGLATVYNREVADHLLSLHNEAVT